MPQLKENFQPVKFHHTVVGRTSLDKISERGCQPSPHPPPGPLAKTVPEFLLCEREPVAALNERDQMN